MNNNLDCFDISKDREFDWQETDAPPGDLGGPLISMEANKLDMGAGGSRGGGEDT